MVHYNVDGRTRNDGVTSKSVTGIALSIDAGTLVI